MSEPTLHAVVHGKVQGVFFRVHTRDAALDLGVTGWVRNLPEGTVEVCARGPRSSLEAFAAWLDHGPPQADVQSVDLEWGVAEDEPPPTFRITG